MREKAEKLRRKPLKLEDIHVEIKRKRITFKELLYTLHGADQSLPPAPRSRTQRAELALRTFERLVQEEIRSNGWTAKTKSLERFLVEGNFGAILTSITALRGGILAYESSAEGVAARREIDDPRMRVEKELAGLEHLDLPPQGKKSKSDWVRKLAKDCKCSEGLIWKMNIDMPPNLIKPKTNH